MKRTLICFVALLLCFSFILCTGCNKEDDKSGGAHSDGAVENSGEEINSDESSDDGEAEEALGELNQGYVIDEGAPSAKGDVIVIQLNNTAAFAMDSGVMPLLSAFAEKGACYDNFYAQQGAEEGIYSALTSLYAPLDEIDGEGKYYTLAHIFAENGYKTHGLLESLDEGTASALGIEDFSDVINLELLDNDESDFIFAELDIIEYPYIPLNTEGVAIEGNRSLNSYLCCAADLDASLGVLLDAITTASEKAPTVVIYGTAPKLDGKFTVYGDEYTELFENGFSYDQIYQTPFIIKAEGFDKGAVADFATVYDIFPTLAALYGFDGERMLVSGENLYMNSTLPETAGSVTMADNLALNKGYTLTLANEAEGEPAFMFAALADDGVKLTDGTENDGTGNPGSDIGVVLRLCEREHYITVDLGEVKSIDRAVMAGVAEVGTTYYGLNGDFGLAVSTDGSSFTTVEGSVSRKAAAGGIHSSYTKSLNEAVDARYVRFAFSGEKNYLSITEVMIYEALPITETEIDLDSFRFFAPQGEYTRGSFITDTVYYTKGEGVASVYAKATMNELSVRTYKDYHKAVLATINECEYAVKCGFFGGELTIDAMYKGLPGTNALTLNAEDSSVGGGSMVGNKGYLSNYTVKYTAAALSGIWDGLTVKDGCLVLADGVKTGTLVTEEMALGDFEKLYIVPQGILNGGTVRIYVTYADNNGVNTPWILIDEYEGSGATATSGVLEVKASDGSAYAAKSFRIMIELEDKDDANPQIEGLNVTPVLIPEAVQELPNVEEAVEVSASFGGGTADSGISAVEALVSIAMSAEPDFENACAYIGGLACTEDCTPASTAALARYAQEKGLNAFVDCYGIAEIIKALDYDQPIVMKHGEGYVIATGYSENGLTVIDPVSGNKSVLSFEDITINTEVLIVDSTLRTPQIIDDIIAEDSAVRPGIVVDKKKYIVIHCTGNYAPGSTAAAHATYLHGLANSPDRSVSWHYTVDKDEIYHHLPDNESAWHASDGTHGEGNKYGIGIETCVNGFPNVYEGEEYEAWLEGFTVTLKNLSYLVAKLMIENDIGMDGIKQHWDFAPDKKNCPMQMRYCSGSGTFEHEGDMWVYLMGQIELQYNRLTEEGYGQ